MDDQLSATILRRIDHSPQLNDEGAIVIPKTYVGTLKNHITEPIKREMFRLKDASARTFQLSHKLSAWLPVVQVMNINTNELVQTPGVRVIRQGLIEITFNAPIVDPNGRDAVGIPYGYSVTLIG